MILTSPTQTATTIELKWNNEVIKNRTLGLYSIRYKQCNSYSAEYTYTFSTTSSLDVTHLTPNTCYKFSIQGLIEGCDFITDWSPETYLYTAIQKDHTKCPNPYVELNDLPGECFHFSAKVATRFEAWKQCNALDGHLAVLDNREKNYAVQNYLNKYMNGTKLNWWWIDGTDRNSPGKWMWETTNTEITYSDWELEKDNPRHCIYLTTGRVKETWRRWNCDDNEKWDYYYICQARLSK